MLKKSFALFALSILAVPAFSNNLIVNGDFSLDVPSNATGNGWTSSSIDGSGGWRASGGNPDGTFFLNSNGAAPHPTLTQTITGLTVGGTYTIAGDWSVANVGNGTNKDFAVEIDGNEWDYNVPATLIWRSFSDSFVASSSTVTLDLVGERNGSDCDPRVDNISLSPSGTPEPCTMVLSLVAGGAFVRRRLIARSGR